VIHHAPFSRERIAMSEPIPDLHARLNAETARIAWSELHTFFARGVVIRVGAELDLVEVAARMAGDDKTTIGSWTARGLVTPVSDEQARDWFARNPMLWAVVVAPWVLVQEKDH
jgi:hypothetical protein